MRWKTICFDLDNTLFSHEEAFEKAICFCFDTLLKAKNLQEGIDRKKLFTIFKKYSDVFWSDYETGVLSQTDYRRKRFLQTVKYFNLPFTNSEADDFHEHYYLVVDGFSEPYPELSSLMENLTKANIKLGIITNGNADTQYNKINKLELNQWLSDDCILISEEVKVCKPNREIFDLAKKKLQSDGNYLFVGDSWEHDVIGAIEAGWDSIFLNTRNETRKTEHSPVNICYSLPEVAKFIYKENKLEG